MKTLRSTIYEWSYIIAVLDRSLDLFNVIHLILVKTGLVMAIAFGQVIFLKLQRILLVAICLCCVFLIVTLYSTLQLGSTLGSNEDALYQTSSDNIIKQGLANGRPDLVKYIHLDLKGAPPKADVFYDRFFQFLNNIQMGVKGVLIEYEDTLPLQDKLVDVSMKK